jgi:hypothetical protein
MTGKEIFKNWTPVGAKWIDWVRPVQFITINDNVKNRAMDFAVPTINYINKTMENTAIIIDLPEGDSIKEGIALARLGFRPIPLYNGVDEQQGAMALVNNHNIKKALIWGAIELKKLALPLNAPPAFLTDSNRTHRFKMDVSAFDNSWDLYDQDLPSAEYLINNNINKIIVRGETIQKDLDKILYVFQKKGITIFFTNGYEEPKITTIKKPPRKHK